MLLPSLYYYVCVLLPACDFGRRHLCVSFRTGQAVCVCPSRCYYFARHTQKQALLLRTGRKRTGVCLKQQTNDKLLYRDLLRRLTHRHDIYSLKQNMEKYIVGSWHGMAGGLFLLLLLALALLWLESWPLPACLPAFALPAMHGLPCCCMLPAFAMPLPLHAWHFA